MFYTRPTVGNSIVKSDIQILTDQFFQGEFLLVELSDYVFKSIARTYKEPYIQCVDKVKQILSHSKIEYYQSFIIIKSSVTLTEEEKAVLIRFINLSISHKNKIIIFNSDIIYIPEYLKKFSDEDLNLYINTSFRSYTKNRKLKILAYKFGLKKLIPLLR